MKVNDKGYSLVEMIVVIAIIVVVAAGGVVGISTISNRPAQKVAQIMLTNIQSNRNIAMGKNSASLKLFVDASGNIKAEETIDGGSPKTYYLGNEDVDIEVESTDGTTVDLASNDVTLVFDRSTGVIKPFGSESGAMNGKTLKTISVSRAGKTYIISVSSLTGRVSMN